MPRLLTKPELLDKVGLSFAKVWELIRQGKFPRAREAFGAPRWVESEVDAWIESLGERKYKPWKPRNLPVKKYKGKDAA